MSICLSRFNSIELRLAKNSRLFATSSRLNNNDDDLRPAARVLKLFKKRDFEKANRTTLKAHENIRLSLAERTKHNMRFKLRDEPKEPKIVTRERKLPSLVELASPYEKYSKKEIEEIESHGTYFDPLFNPLLHEDKYKVDPEEEPFNAIYADSKSEESNEYTKVRDITTPELWSYVERLASIKVAPKPKPRKLGEPIVPLPSGYVPPPEQPPDLPYFVARTRNYMLPVYYHLDNDPDECFTQIKQVTGDLWKLEEDLRQHLEGLNESRKRILTSVREADESIAFRGRYLHQVVSWLQERGF